MIMAGIGLHHLPTNIEDSADPRVSISHVFTRFSTICSSDPAAWFLVLPGRCGSVNFSRSEVALRLLNTLKIMFSNSNLFQSVFMLIYWCFP